MTGTLISATVVHAQWGNPLIYPFRDPSGDMTEETSVDPLEETDCANPVGLSLAGGAVGTITGLKRGGVPGAIAGGLVGGTVGYVSGAVSRDATTVVDDPPAADEPIHIEAAEAPPTDSEAAESTTDATDEDDTDDASDDTDHGSAN